MSKFAPLLWSVCHDRNHGPFYHSDELVAAVHRAEGGIFGTFRAAHAFGRIYAGTFTATPAAKTRTSICSDNF